MSLGGYATLQRPRPFDHIISTDNTAQIRWQGGTGGRA